MKSLGSFSEKNRGNGFENDLTVEPEGPVVDVSEIHLHPVLEAGDAVAPAGLPFACDAGLDAKAAAVRNLPEGFDFIEG